MQATVRMDSSLRGCQIYSGENLIINDYLSLWMNMLVVSLNQPFSENIW